MIDHGTFEKLLEGIRRAVRHFGRFRKRWAVLDGLATFVIVAPGALLVWFLLDWALEFVGWGGLPYWLLLPSFVAVCCLWLWACSRWVLRPQFRRIRTEREALVIENLHGGLDNSLIGSLQLGEEVRAAADRPTAFAPALVRELVRRTAEALDGIRTKALVDLSRPRQRIFGASGIAIVVALCLLFAQGSLRKRAERLSDAYGAFLDVLFPVSMEVESGNCYVVRGRPVTLRVRVEGARRHHVKLLRTDLLTEEALNPELLELTEERAAFELKRTQNSFSYGFEYAGRVSDEYKVLVEDLPEIRAINYEMTPPAYTGLPMRLNSGRVICLKGLVGTVVLVNFTASTELHPELCHIARQTRGKPEMIDISGRFGSFSFEIEGNDRVSIHLTGSFGKGFEMAEPLSFDIAVQRDKPPSIRFLARRNNLEMAPGQAGVMGVSFLAKDDFGVEKVFLEYTVETMEELRESDVGRREGRLEKSIDPPRDRIRDQFPGIFRELSPPLRAGDTITIRLRAKDNNTERPGFGYSEKMVIDLFSGGLSDFLPEVIVFDELADLESVLKLAALKTVKREDGLGETANRIVRTEKPREIPKDIVRAKSGQRTIPEDGVAQFFELMANVQAAPASRE